MRISQISAAAVAAILAVGCGGSDRSATDAASDGSGGPTATSRTSVAISVSELFDRQEAGSLEENLLIDVLLLDDGTGLKICEMLSESYPPQCGGRSIPVRNPEFVDIDLTEAEGVRWTDGPVSMLGWVTDGEFIAS